MVNEAEEINTTITLERTARRKILNRGTYGFLGFSMSSWIRRSEEYFEKVFPSGIGLRLNKQCPWPVPDIEVVPRYLIVCG